MAKTKQKAVSAAKKTVVKKTAAKKVSESKVKKAVKASAPKSKAAKPKTAKEQASAIKKKTEKSVNVKSAATKSVAPPKKTSNSTMNSSVNTTVGEKKETSSVKPTARLPYSPATSNNYIEPAPKPNRPIKYKYTPEELERFKKIILDKQREIVEQLQNLRDQMLDPTTGEYINENSPYSLHMAEQGTDAMEREKTFLYAQRENKFLGYLEDALKRIEAGTYGQCIECVDEPKFLCETCPLIPAERLEAVPHSQLCVQIKKRQEKPRRI